jgi:hypothetical protein
MATLAVHTVAVEVPLSEVRLIATSAAERKTENDKLPTAAALSPHAGNQRGHTVIWGLEYNILQTGVQNAGT